MYFKANDKTANRNQPTPTQKPHIFFSENGNCIKKRTKRSFPLYQFVFPKPSSYFSAFQISAYYSFDRGQIFSSSYIEIIHSATVKLFGFNVDEY